MGLLRAVFDTFCRADVEETKPSAFGGAGRPGGGSLVRSATMKANRGLAPNAKTMNLEEFARVIRESKLQKARDGAQLSNQVRQTHGQRHARMSHTLAPLHIATGRPPRVRSFPVGRSNL